MTLQRILTLQKIDKAKQRLAKHVKLGLVNLKLWTEKEDCVLFSLKQRLTYRGEIGTLFCCRSGAAMFARHQALLKMDNKKNNPSSKHLKQQTTTFY